ncbi:MAG: hypothetical protein ACYSWR_03625 [Planctomycetota bacterium]|jgi:hypothetical protein
MKIVKARESTKNTTPLSANRMQLSRIVKQREFEGRLRLKKL